jgi:hypothetical protein
MSKDQLGNVRMKRLVLQERIKFQWIGGTLIPIVAASHALKRALLCSLCQRFAPSDENSDHVDEKFDKTFWR